MKRLVATYCCLLLLLRLDVQAADITVPGPDRLPSAVRGAVDFDRDIHPILARSCLSCHGALRQKGGLRLDAGPAALKGGNSGPVLTPGSAARSRLLFIVAGLDPDLKMPPAGKKPLTAEEVGRLRAWVEQGAKWGKSDAGAAALAARSAHWAFQPVRRPALPSVRNGRWVHNEIDRFILARLEAEGIAPSPEADRPTLIRRVSLDLTGLPPTPAEVDAFARDPRSDAYERLVDRLLASPAYGERWGRHWLDAARYADSDGYEKDTGRPHAWRWRDWVIDALNGDMPYDEFAVEQLAGDLLPNATTEQKVATGFHRNTLTNREGGVDAEQFRVEQVVDRVMTTGTVFLGLTIGCARCHDHKYDPISQREFYQFFAFFNSDVETDIAAPLPGETEAEGRKRAEFAKKKAELDAAVAAYRKGHLPAAEQKWEAGLTLPVLRKLPPAIAQTVLVEPARRSPQQGKGLAAYYAKIDPKLAGLNRELAELQKNGAAEPLAQTLALGPRRTTHVMVRGDFLRPGAEVQPGTPAVLPPLHATAGGTRLDLARWIVSPDNPLTPRVAVNWMWQKYFGRGIVATPEDFGTQGDRPSHPELLDYLASQFVRCGWSMKAMHRLIVTSATYRQSAKARPELHDRDPVNVLLARQNRLRLEAEVLRDSALTCSGLLVRRVGGPSVHPPQPAGISDLTYAGSAHWVEDTGPDRYRRGLYTWFQRTSPYPMLLTFDAPDANVCCVRRDRTDSPLQALTLMNDSVFVECSRALARRILAETAGQDDAGRVRHAFRLCLAREPTSAETESLRRLYEGLVQACRGDPAAAAKLAGAERAAGSDITEAAAWTAFARALLNLDEFVTRE